MPYEGNFYNAPQTSPPQLGPQSPVSPGVDSPYGKAELVGSPGIMTPRQSRTYFGMTRTVFLLALVLIFLIVGGVIGGAIGGTLTSKKHSKSFSSSDCSNPSSSVFPINILRALQLTKHKVVLLWRSQHQQELELLPQLLFLAHLLALQPVHRLQ